MVEVKRKKGETFESLLRRFTRHLVKSNRLNIAKENRFHSKDTSRNSKKQATLTRLKMGKKREYLKKIGRLEEKDTNRRW